MFRFEKLDVWHRAIELADVVYSVTRLFPDEEKFGLVSQMRRASVSISSHIAEGSGRASDSDFARFLDIAYGSLMEAVSQGFVAHRQQFLNHDDLMGIYHPAEELARMLSGLRGSLLARKA